MRGNPISEKEIYQLLMKCEPWDFIGCQDSFECLHKTLSEKEINQLLMKYEPWAFIGCHCSCQLSWPSVVIAFGCHLLSVCQVVISFHRHWFSFP